MRNSNSIWIFESAFSGCIAHICDDGESFQRMHQSDRIRLNLASQAVAKIKDEGEVLVIVATEQERRLMQFRNTLYPIYVWI